MDDVRWHEVEADELGTDEVKAVIAGGRSICLARTAEGLSALDNRCPHQGGPLGEGTIEHGWLICPWHGYEYDPVSGEPPGAHDDAPAPFPVQEKDDAVRVGVPVVAEQETLMDRVDEPEDLESVLTQALRVDDGPSLVEVRTSPRWT